MGYKFSPACTCCPACTEVSSISGIPTLGTSFNGMYFQRFTTSPYTPTTPCSDFNATIEWQFQITSETGTHWIFTRSSRGGRQATCEVSKSTNLITMIEFQIGSSIMRYVTGTTNKLQKDEANSTCDGCIFFQATNAGYQARAQVGAISLSANVSAGGPNPPACNCGTLFDYSYSATDPVDYDGWAFLGTSGGSQVKPTSCYPDVITTTISASAGTLRTATVTLNFNFDGSNIFTYDIYDISIDGPRDPTTPFTSATLSATNIGHSHPYCDTVTSFTISF